VSRRARIRAAAAASVALVIGLLLASSVVPNTFSLWQAESTNTGSVYAGGWLPPATTSGASLSVTGSNQDQVHLSSWTSGYYQAEPNPNKVDGQELEIADGGSAASAGCPAHTGAGWNDEAALGQTDSSATDSGANSPAFTDWWCYQIVSTLAGTSWRSVPTTLGSIRLLVPTGVSYNSTGKIKTGTTITITFNQNITYSGAGSVTVCTWSTTNSVLIGDAGCAASSDTPTVGRLNGGTVSLTTSICTATPTPSGATLSIAITSCSGNGNTANVSSGPVTYIGSVTTVTSSTGSWAQCSRPATCTPSFASY